MTHQATGSPPETPRLERLATALGFLVTAGILGTIAWHAIDGQDLPPVVVVGTERVDRVEGGWRVIFEARNLGTQAAAGVRIRGAVTHAGGEEESVAVLDTMAPRSRRKGGLFFSVAPETGSFSLRATGYADP